MNPDGGSQGYDQGIVISDTSTDASAAGTNLTFLSAEYLADYFALRVFEAQTGGKTAVRFLVPTGVGRAGAIKMTAGLAASGDLRKIVVHVERADRSHVFKAYTDLTLTKVDEGTEEGSAYWRITPGLLHYEPEWDSSLTRAANQERAADPGFYDPIAPLAHTYKYLAGRAKLRIGALTITSAGSRQSVRIKLTTGCSKIVICGPKLRTIPKQWYQMDATVRPLKPGEVIPTFKAGEINALDLTNLLVAE